MKKNDKLELAQWAVDYAIKHGADQSAASISRRRNVEIQHRDGKLEKIQESTSNSLDLNIYANHRYSGHSTCDLKKTSLEKFIKEAVAMTKYLSEDEYRKLPDPELYEGQKDIDLEITDPSYQELTSEKRVEIAKQIEEMAHSVSDKIISATAGCGDSFSESVKVHSNGFVGERIGTSFYAGAEATVEGEEGKRPEDWYYASCRYFNQLPAADFLGKQAAERALKKIGQDKIKSDKMIMLVENRTARRLLYAMRRPLSGRALQQKSSFLEGKLNEKIASEKLTLIDDPFIKKGLGSRLY
ncbi:TldD/PmbA family protein, partial [candidate division KSB1 bacterium]|nr:TldD/PmbA family protein [candidate division KSB1 bacterium]